MVTMAAEREPLLQSYEPDSHCYESDIFEGFKLFEDLEMGGFAGKDETEIPEEDEVYKMKELIKEKPHDVIQYIEEEGVIRLGEFQVQDSLAFQAFGKEPILTLGDEHLDIDWEARWKEKLSEYERKSGMGWTTTITMEAHAVNLRDAAAEGSRGLLHPLLKRFQARGCPMAVFALPAVQAVIHYKWTTWARRFLLYELASYLAWLASFTTFSLIFQHEDPTTGWWQLLSSPLGLAAVVANFVAVVAMTPFLYMELCTLAAYGAGWINLWNMMDMASYVLQLVIFYLHLTRREVETGWFSILLSSQHVLMWSKLHYFAKVFNPTKNTIVHVIAVVIDDMKWFLLFLGLTMVGFGFAFYSLFRQDRDRFADFTNVWHSFASMFSYLLAMFDYNVFYTSTNPTAAMILFTIFEFIMNVIALNIMIASMTNAFSKVTQDEGLRFLCSKAQMIDELESTLPRWVKGRSWFPPFVHILKFHPTATYDINLNSLWSNMGHMENNLMNAQQETRLRVEEIEHSVIKINRKIDVMVKMMFSMMNQAQHNQMQTLQQHMPASGWSASRSNLGAHMQHAHSGGAAWQTSEPPTPSGQAGGHGWHMGAHPPGSSSSHHAHHGSHGHGTSRAARAVSRQHALARSSCGPAVHYERSRARPHAPPIVIVGQSSAHGPALGQNTGVLPHSV